MVGRGAPWWKNTLIHKWILLTLAGLVAARLLLAVSSPAGLEWDFANFYNTGVRVYLGESEDLYRYAFPTTDRPAQMARRFEYFGFPVSAYLYTPLGALTPRTGLLSFKIACALFCALGLLILYWHYRTLQGTDLSAAGLLLVVLVYEPIWRVFSIGGQSTPLAFLLVCAFLWSYATARFFMAALFLSAAILIKPFLILMLFVFLFAAEWGLLFRLGVCLSMEAALSLYLFGWATHADWLALIIEAQSRWAVPWWQNCSALGFFANFWFYREDVNRLAAPPHSLQIIHLAFRALLAVTFALLTRRTSQATWPTPDKKHQVAILAILFALSFPTTTWIHYLIFLLIPLLYYLCHYHHLSRPVRISTVVVLLLTLRANLWLSRDVISQVSNFDSFWQLIAVGLLGSGALIVSLLLFTRPWSGQTLHSGTR